MANWKLHLPTEDNLFDQYKYGLTAGDRVRLKKDLVVTDSNGLPTGEVHPAGEEWVVLSGVKVGSGSVAATPRWRAMHVQR